MQDNGTSQSPADPDGLTFWQRDVGGDGVEVLWNHGDPNLLLAGSQGGNLSRSADGGNSWFYIPDAKAGSYAPFISKIAGSKQDADLVFTVGNAGVKRSDNFGQSWTLIPVNGNWMGWRTFDNVEISTADPQVVWISSRLKYEDYIGARGGIHISRDGGLSFTEISANFPAGMTESSGIGTDPIDPATAFMLFSAAGGPKILKTTDYGQTWNDLSAFNNKESSNGFPDVATYALIVMPYDRNIIWAGTEIGLFISEDAGQNWFLADNGLPQVSIFQMAIVDGQIILATQGLGIWTVDIPELAGYQPPVVTLTPRFNDLAFQPVGNVRISYSLRSPYDSTLISLNDQRWIKLGPNMSRKDSTLYFPVTSNATLTFDIASYKDGREFSSAGQSVDVYITSVQSSYSSDFNSPGASEQFTGDGFSIQSYSGFESSAIHSEHPYPVNKEFTYLLLIPIAVGSENTILTYEDVVLIEEGSVSDYTDPRFWDYVIVEGSKDGSNWLPLADGYDSQYDPDWSAAYRSGIVSGGDSNTVGNSSMYVTHTIDLLDTFNTGDIIFIRFRLLSDPAVVAWGWAIDNLNIQQTDIIEIPEEFALAQNYPNPFNLTTTIEYDLPGESNVKISVFNILGQKVITLVDAFQTAGAAKTITWNGLDKNNIGVASGTYLYRIEAGSFSQTKKMVLLK